MHSKLEPTGQIISLICWTPASRATTANYREAIILCTLIEQLAENPPGPATITEQSANRTARSSLQVTSPPDDQNIDASTIPPCSR